MEYLSITFPDDLRKELDKEAKRQKTKRSTLIQKAVKVYLTLKKKKHTRDLLREGYMEMAGESKAIMNEFKDLDDESLKNVD